MKLTSRFLATALVSSQMFAQSSPSENAILPIQAQSSSPTGLLHVTGNIPTASNAQLYGEAACDGTGNVYMRLRGGAGSSQSPSHVPVQEIKADGSLASAFDAAGAMLEFAISDFYIAQDASVYFIGRGRPTAESGWQSYVLQFAPAGRLTSTVQIDTGKHVFPAHLAIFNSGEMLITGRQGPEENTPFTGVFTAEGKLIKEIFEPEDEELRKRAQAGDKSVVHGAGFGNDAVDLGAMAIDPADGNAYLMRSISPAMVFVISKRGEVVRKFQVAADDALMSPVRLQAFSGGIVILFARPGFGSILKVTDSVGNPTGTYAVDRRSVGDLACFSPPTFTFIGVEDDLLHLYRLQPR